MLDTRIELICWSDSFRAGAQTPRVTLLFSDANAYTYDPVTGLWRRMFGDAVNPYIGHILDHFRGRLDMGLVLSAMKVSKSQLVQLWYEQEKAPVIEFVNFFVPEARRDILFYEISRVVHNPSDKCITAAFQLFGSDWVMPVLACLDSLRELLKMRAADAMYRTLSNTQAICVPSIPGNCSSSYWSTYEALAVLYNCGFITVVDGELEVVR